MAKLARNALAHYLNSGIGTGGDKDWFLLGVDLEELSVELNPEVEKVRNILGQNSIRDKGYDPSATADPYYANPEDSIYEPIRNIALDRLTGEACNTKILEVIIEDTTASNHLAYTEEVVVKPTSYGGGTDGVTFPFDIHFTGNRTKGTVVITDGKPVFTAATTTTE